ncbi:MAG: hypothetical protein RLZZ301_328 [Bacteroidota bacterium]|jgi:D-alanine-D-alanine ligase
MKRIGLFCGGFSSEFNISIKSAQTIQAHFPTQYELILIEVKRPNWEANYKQEKAEFDLTTGCIRTAQQEVQLDAAIIYTHGEPGENGKIQALLDMLQIPYLNAGVLASSLSFDKWYCNQFLRAFDIPVAKSELVYKHQPIDAARIIAALGLPLFIKPADSGSSYGISKVKSEAELLPAFEKAFQEGNSVVVESFLDGTEVTCGVYRTTTGIQALPLTEIVSETEFFDYEAKYAGKSQEITPARLPESIRDQVQAQAISIYRLLNLRSIARIDFMIVNDVPHVIEVNTTPGFSPASIVPQMLNAAGISITDFWQSLISAELGL